MCSDKNQFITIEPKEDGGVVTFEDNGQGKIVGIGKIQINSTTFIDNVLYVKGLKHNLISISQLCVKGYTVSFGTIMCVITNPMDDSFIFIGNRYENVYIIDLNNISNLSQCLMANEVKNDEISWLCHRRLGHASMDLMSKLVKKNLVKGLLKVNYERNRLCDACQLGKQTKNTFKPKNIVSTTRPLELLHMDLFGPTRTTSLGGKRYGLMIVDDYSRFTWVMFLAHKDETFSLF